MYCMEFFQALISPWPMECPRRVRKVSRIRSSIWFVKTSWLNSPRVAE